MSKTYTGQKVQHVSTTDLAYILNLVKPTRIYVSSKWVAQCQGMAKHLQKLIRHGKIPQKNGVLRTIVGPDLFTTSADVRFLGSADALSQSVGVPTDIPGLLKIYEKSRLAEVSRHHGKRIKAGLKMKADKRKFCYKRVEGVKTKVFLN